MIDGLRTLFAEYDVLGAFWMTIKLTVLSAIGSLVIGTVVAVLRVSPVSVLRLFGTTYVNIIRNTPLTLIVFFRVRDLQHFGDHPCSAGLTNIHRRQQLPVRGDCACGLPRSVHGRGVA